MKLKQQIFLTLLSIFLLGFMSCKTVPAQTEWKTDASEIQKDIKLSQKNAFIIFTLSDTDDRSKYLLDSVFTKDFFETATDKFTLYNVNIVRDESLMPAKDLERNYTLLSDYGVLEVPFLCLLTREGDVYHHELIPQDIKSTEDFLKYLNELYEKGESVEEIKLAIAKADGVEKIKAIDNFFNNIYSVNSEKYSPLFKLGIESDPENKSGLTGKFILADKQITVDRLLAEKKFAAAIKEFMEVLETKMLKPEEEQATWCNIAYFASAIPDTPKKEIIAYLQKALNIAPKSARAKDIKDDIIYLQNKKDKN